ncbi:hypothetical protein [Sporosarcina sp. OR05]
MTEKERAELIAAINQLTSYPPSYYDSLTDDQLKELHSYHAERRY